MIPERRKPLKVELSHREGLTLGSLVTAERTIALISEALTTVAIEARGGVSNEERVAFIADRLRATADAMSPPPKGAVIYVVQHSDAENDEPEWKSFDRDGMAFGWDTRIEAEEYIRSRVAMRDIEDGTDYRVEEYVPRSLLDAVNDAWEGTTARAEKAEDDRDAYRAAIDDALRHVVPPRTDEPHPENRILFSGRQALANARWFVRLYEPDGADVAELRERARLAYRRSFIPNAGIVSALEERARAWASVELADEIEESAS